MVQQDATLRGPAVHCDVLILGGGVSGLRAALAAAEHAQVMVITKDVLQESSTAYAQGGVAAVLGRDDSFESHQQDTLKVGHGLCHPDAVETVVKEGPERIRELLDWGGEFDLDGDELDLAREGGHSRRRVVHAHGDATGFEVMTTLMRRVQQHKNIEVREFGFATDLLTHQGRCVGARVLDASGSAFNTLARSTILCTGGIGQLFRETTNPMVATGDGIAMAWRAGVELADMEFVQFHPTSLYVAGAARHLITEAVRGEGARLLDSHGERFVSRYHPDGDLAPRDIVSRAIVEELAHSGESCVWLDLTHMGDRAHERFPGISKMCALYGIDIAKQNIPVQPAAHYGVGGVVVDLEGRSSLPGLYAAGEVAMSGLHGANRLASNSLLEGLVFGRRAGAHAASTNAMAPTCSDPVSEGGELAAVALHARDFRNSVQSLMWRAAGIIRCGDKLQAAERTVQQWLGFVNRVHLRSYDAREARNLVTVAALVLRGALWREESRGTHYRSDHPERDDARFRVHCQQQLGRDIHARPL
ncbi:MAG: L-aspartate oxidase [Planctomycetes bacterium]|nr:L-aspartate oxidase [Planctomycetota bacterium]